MFVKAFFSLGNSAVPGFAEGRTRQGRAAPGGEGKLLSGHEFSGLERVPGRPADRSKASTGCGSRFAGQAAPGAWRSAAGAQVVADLAGDVALQAADDLFLGQSFVGAPGDVGAGGGVVAHPGDDDPPQGVVGLAVAAGIEAVTADLPR